MTVEAIFGWARPRWSWILGIGALALLLWFWLAPVARLVSVAPVTTGSAADVVYASGVVEPERWAEVAPLLRERIIETCRCEGETVKAGTLLFKLDASQAEAQLAEIEARLALAHQQLLRAADLLERGVSAQARYDEALASVTELEARRAAQRRGLAQYGALAPLDGQVLRLDGEIGEVAEPGKPLAWVGQASPKLVISDVNEEDIPKVEIGQRALLRADAFPERALEAVVGSITPKGDPELKTYRVRLALPEDTPLYIGMSVDVNIVVAEKPGARLAPAAALVEDSAGAAVFVVEDGRAERRAVEIGLRTAEAVELLSGPEPGTLLVSPAVDGLASGARVRVRDGASGGEGG